MNLAQLTLAVNPDGNWQLDPDGVPNNFPSIALPARDFPIAADTSRYGNGAIRAVDARLAQEYATALLRAAKVRIPETGLTWQHVGHTLIGGREYPAYRATWEVFT